MTTPFTPSAIVHPRPRHTSHKRWMTPRHWACTSTRSTVKLKLSGIRLKGRQSDSTSWPCVWIWNSCWVWESKTNVGTWWASSCVLGSMWLWVSHNSRGIRGHLNRYDYIGLGQGMLFFFFYFFYRGYTITLFQLWGSLAVVSLPYSLGFSVARYIFSFPLHIVGQEDGSK